MGEKQWQRARQEDQIQQRRQDILEGAAAVFEEHSFESVTLAMIARQAGVTRTNLYRYFSTREEIFLTLYMEDLTHWTQQAESTLKGPLSPDTFIQPWVDSFSDFPRLLRLSPLLAISLEKNSSREFYIQTKQTLARLMDRIGHLLKTLLPELSEQDILDLLQFHQTLAAGAWPLSHPTEEQRQILKDHNLDHLIIDFQTLYSKSLSRYLRGIVQP